MRYATLERRRLSILAAVSRVPCAGCVLQKAPSGRFSDLDVSEMMVICILDKSMDEGTMRCLS
jgi:hypothetical protein